MPIGALGLTLIGGALSAGGQGWNNRNQKKQNEADRAHQLAVMEKERAWALEDFARENSYNSPEEQMNRLRQAGLNPNLVYGKGATTTAGAIRNVQGKDQSQKAPQIDPNSIINGATSAFQLQLQNAQRANLEATTDNLTAQNAVIQKEALLKESQISKNVQDTATTTFQLEQAKELKDSVIKKANLENQLTNKKIQTETVNQQYTMGKNGRETRKTIEDILTQQIQRAKTSEETKQLKQSRDAIKRINVSNAEIKEAEAKLRSLGINPNDPTYMRVLVQLLESYVSKNLPPFLK